MRYIDITFCTHNAVNVTTVKRIDYSKSARAIASSGDGDKQTTFLAKGASTVTGTIVLEDPVQAATLEAAAAADLTFKGTAGNDLTNKDKVIVKNVIFFSLSGSHVHDDIHGVQLGWQGSAPAGTPVLAVSNETP